MILPSFMSLSTKLFSICLFEIYGYFWIPVPNTPLIHCSNPKIVKPHLSKIAKPNKLKASTDLRLLIANHVAKFYFNE